MGGSLLSPRAGLVAASALALVAAGCATVKGPPSSASARPLFRVADGGYPQGRAAWYSPARPPQFNRTGLAVWSEAPKRSSVGAWFSRVFRRNRSPAVEMAPVGLIAADQALPVPSIVTVTNPTSGAAVRVRVERRVALRGALISLPAPLAHALELDAARPALVQVRYAEPVLVDRGRPDLRTALRARSRSEPQLAAADLAKPPPVAARTVSAPVAPTPAVPQPLPSASAPAVAASSSPFLVQAGAFADPANAERARLRLARTGVVAIEPLHRNGATLYRVTVRGASGAASAEALQRDVVSAGFTDARILRAG